MRPDAPISWNAYPAVLAAAALALGILCAHRFEAVPLLAWVGLGCMCGLSALLAARPSARLVTLRPLLLTVLVGLMLAAVGAARTADLAGRTDGPLAAVARHELEVVLEGRIGGPPHRSEEHLRFDLSVERVIAGGDTLSTPGRVRVSVWPDAEAVAPLPPLTAGDVVAVRGRLRPPPPRRNPADFDYGAYLRRQGLEATLTAYDADAVQRLGAKRSVIGDAVVAARAYVRAQVQTHVPSEPAQQVLVALLLGDRARLDAATQDTFARTGLLHLLAVSGLHVMLVGWMLYQLLKPLLLRAGLRWRSMELSRSVGTALLLGLYVAVTGAPASVVRATVMAVLLMGGVLVQRSSSSLNTLGVAALVLLLARPTQLLEAGFQLSFAAVAAIITLNPILQAPLPRRLLRAPWRGAVTLTTTSLAATLGTLPVLLAHFGQASFAGLLLNLPAIPLTMATLASGLVTLLLGGLPVLPDLAGSAASAAAALLLAVAEAGDRLLPWLLVRVADLDGWTLSALIAALVMLALWPRPRHRWRLAGASLGCLALGVWLPLVGTSRTAPLDVLFLDVGQGDAVLLSLPGDRHVLVDAGRRDRYTDQGTRTVVPHLRWAGIDALDALVISHADGDHLGGVPAVLRSVPVRRVVHNGLPHGSALFDETQHLLDSLAVPQHIARAGDTLAVAPGVRIEVLGPDGATLATGDSNEASVILRVTYGQTRLLLTGDGEDAAEARLVLRYGAALASDVVKVGHHGSRTSSWPAFVRAVRGDSSEASPWAVVSVGRSNRYGHPDAGVLARWEAAGARLASTAGGAVWLRSDGTRFVQVPWR